jgi:hypothetical protein
MKLSGHGNGNGYNDLYILPETKKERETIEAFLKNNKIGYQLSYANVGGHDWNGKTFIEIPLGEYLKETIKNLFIKEKGG